MGSTLEVRRWQGVVEAADTGLAEGLERTDQGRKLLAGRPVRVFQPFPRRRFGAAPGAFSPAETTA